MLRGSILCHIVQLGKPLQPQVGLVVCLHLQQGCAEGRLSWLVTWTAPSHDCSRPNTILCG